MAPGTNLDAATPIQIGGFPGAPQPKDERKNNEPTTAERKAINDVVERENQAAGATMYYI